MTRPSLFRPAARQQQNADTWLGQAVLLQPLSMRLVSWSVLLFAMAMLAFMFYGQYTKRVAASGVLAPDAGLLKVQSPQPGVVLERRVREGQRVAAGEVLYVVSSEVVFEPGKGVASTALGNLQARQSIIRADTALSDQVAARTVQQTRERVRLLQSELEQFELSLKAQQARLASKQSQFERHQQAQAQGFLSPMALQQKQDDVLEQQSRLHDMQRNRLALVRELDEARTQLDSAASKNALERSNFERQALEVEQDRLAQQTRNRVLVTAPQAGVVTAVLAEPGQRVEGQTLLTIVPAGSQLEGQIFVPSQAIGFIREGDKVSLRLAAFPNLGYCKFEGRVTEISSATLAPDEQGGKAPDAQPRYRVRVGLPAQSLDGHALRAGMEVDAQFPQERRTLAGWIFEPLYRLKEKL